MFLRRVRLRSSTNRAFHDFRPYIEDSRWSGLQVIIGIETHAQIKSRQKLFSESLTSGPRDSPNTNVSLFDAAFPGTLPRVNSKAVDLAIRTALAFQSRISTRSLFDRKHYFYSDQPLGYQITQQYSPIATGGQLEVTMPNTEPFTVRIKQIQMEQDTAKTTIQIRSSKAHIDLNRAGTGLLEIVSEPDIRSPEEAGAYVKALRSVLRAVGASDGNMEQGSLRFDVNVSVNRKGDPPGTRCEIKNLNSVRFIMAAILHEIERQSAFINANPSEQVPQETRGFNEDTFTTFRLRSKEDAPDYRYMPDPNLGVLVISESRINDIKEKLPALPWEIRARLEERHPRLKKHGQIMETLFTVDEGREIGFDGEGNGGAVEYFERLCETPRKVGHNEVQRDPVTILNWLTYELLGQLSARKKTFSDNTITSDQFGELIDLVQDGTITGTSGKRLLRHMLDNPSSRPVKEIATELDLLAMNKSSNFPSSAASTSSSQPSELETLCLAAIADLPSEVKALRAGNTKVINKIVGYVMKKSKGRADATETRSLVQKLVLGDNQ